MPSLNCIVLKHLRAKEGFIFRRVVQFKFSIPLQATKFSNAPYAPENCMAYESCFGPCMMTSPYRPTAARHVSYCGQLCCWRGGVTRRIVFQLAATFSLITRCLTAAATMDFDAAVRCHGLSASDVARTSKTACTEYRDTFLRTTRNEAESRACPVVTNVARWTFDDVPEWTHPLLRQVAKQYVP